MIEEYLQIDESQMIQRIDTLTAEVVKIGDLIKIRSAARCKVLLDEVAILVE